MTYSSNQDIVDAVGQDTVRRLTDDDGSGIIGTDVLQGTREDARQIIDAYVRGRYELPFGETPALLRQIETALVVERLYRRRPSADTPESVSDAAEEAMSQLRMISTGTITLGVDGDGDGDDDGADSYRSSRSSDKPTLRDLLSDY